MIGKFRAWSLPFLAAVVVIAALTVIVRATYATWNSRRVAVVEADCRDAMRRKDWPSLENHARQWLAIDEHSSLGWLFLAEAAQRQNKMDLTAQSLASISDRDPRSVPALLELVELQLGRLKRPLDAVETCQRILRINASEPIAHQRLVFIYALSLQRRPMIEQIRAAARAGCLNPEMVVYLLNAPSLRFSNGVVTNTEWLSSHPDAEAFEVARAVQLAQISHSSGSTFLSDNALKPGDESLIVACREKYPQNAEVLAYFLEKASAKGDFEEVARILESAPPDAEADSRFWRAKGSWHLNQNEDELAAESFQSGLKQDPFDWRTRHQYSNALRRLGKLDEVERETALALEGKQLERQLFEIPTAGEIPPPLRPAVLKYCDQIGDTEMTALISKTLPLLAGPAASVRIPGSP